MRKANVTLQQLRVLVAVVEAGSFTRAAEVLRMTQPGVSHTIAGLERELKVSLLERDRGGATPTDAGERVLSRAREALGSVELLLHEASDTRDLRAGRVRIGSFPSAATRLLPGIIGAFGRRYPGVEVALLEGTDEEVLGWISSRAVDVGFVALPAPEGLETADISEDELLVVLPEDHALAEERTLRVEQIVGAPFVMSGGGCEPLVRAVFRSAGAKPLTRFEARDTGTVLAMVAEGLGVSLVPELALPRDTADLGVRGVPLHPPVRRRLALAVRSFDVASPAVKAFVEQARSLPEDLDRP